MDHLLLKFCNIAIVHFLPDHFIESGFLCFLNPHSLNRIIIRNCLNLSHDSFVMRRGDLCAILPVYLVSIILRRIMAGCNVNSGYASKGANSIRKFRRRAQGFKHVRLDSVSGKAQCSFICKLRGHAPGIVCDRHAFRLTAILHNIVGKPLGCLPDRIDVHAVRSCADDSS